MRILVRTVFQKGATNWGSGHPLHMRNFFPETWNKKGDCVSSMGKWFCQCICLSVYLSNHVISCTYWNILERWSIVADPGGKNNNGFIRRRKYWPPFTTCSNKPRPCQQLRPENGEKINCVSGVWFTREKNCGRIMEAHELFTVQAG